ncbi:MAG: hypothetical protein DHS20C13_26610 [Thermodesulfobacteriota bacterium]|nr:MAG: hypothetical protein DHS20C13_26610 [Thermodesulfobacteriota bacterium]
MVVLVDFALVNNVQDYSSVAVRAPSASFGQSSVQIVVAIINELGLLVGLSQYLYVVGQIEALLRG